MNEFDSDAVMLEHETEQEVNTPVAPSPPVPVVVVDAVSVSEIVPQHTSFRTVVLTSDNPMLQILPLDPLRVSATLCSHDRDVVLAGSRDQAADKANVSDASLLRPNGALLSYQAGFPVPVTISSVDPVWVSAPAYPARVSAVITRRTT